MEFFGNSVLFYVIVGGILSIPFVILLFTCCLACCCCRKKKKSRDRNHAEEHRPLISTTYHHANNNHVNRTRHEPPAPVRYQAAETTTTQRALSVVTEKHQQEEEAAAIEFMNADAAQFIKTPYVPMVLNRFQELNIEKFEVQDEIVRGDFGTTYLAKITSDGSLVSVKIPNNSNDEFLLNRRAMERELDALASVDRNHENVVKLIGAITKPKEAFVIVTEYCAGGSLREFLIRERERGVEIDDSRFTLPREEDLDEKLTTGDLLTMALKVARGMSFLNDRRCLHIDLRSCQILLDGKLNPKISGFSLHGKTHFPNEFVSDFIFELI